MGNFLPVMEQASGNCKNKGQDKRRWICLSESTTHHSAVCSGCRCRMRFLRGNGWRQWVVGEHQRNCLTFMRSHTDRKTCYINMQQWNIVSVCLNRPFTQFKVEQKSVWFSNLAPAGPAPNGCSSRAEAAKCFSCCGIIRQQGLERALVTWLEMIKQ